jgi:predicted dehydrogenase
MKKIGFIDLYLDEWHANNYPDWIRSNAMKHGRDCELAYAWAETNRDGGMDTSAWCDRYQVQKLASIEELVEKSDYLVILAPDHPEHHERLARIPLMSGKPVYVDKTFSSDLSSGIRMFELAKRHNTPMFSSSALRYAQELAGFLNNPGKKDEIEFVATTGSGSFDHYSVHQFEMIVSIMGPRVQKVKSLSSTHGRLLVLEYADGRQASMLQLQKLPFQVSLQHIDGQNVFIPTCTDIFPRLIDHILDFFESGRPPVPQEETLGILAIIEAGRQAINQRDTWIKVDRD